MQGVLNLPNPSASVVEVVTIPDWTSGEESGTSASAGDVTAVAGACPLDCRPARRRRRRWQACLSGSGSAAARPCSMRDAATKCAGRKADQDRLVGRG